MIIRQTVIFFVLLLSGVLIIGCSQTQTAGKTDKMNISIVGEKLIISNNSVGLVTYQKAPLTDPAGGDMFKGSDFFHPLKTPSGFIVTELQPEDHLHHFGLWWPWKYVMVNGRKVLFWEPQRGEGIVEAQGVAGYKADKGSASFTAESHYVDRTVPNGPEVVLNEKVSVNVSNIVKSPVSGYYLDVAITHSCAMKSPVEVVAYHYSGFTIRGTGSWNKENSTVLTSQGIKRTGSNFTRADWIRVQGDADQGNKAGFVMMSCPQNRDTPQLLRTWDKESDNAIFINFNPVQEKPWLFEPGKEYTQKYRLFIYDGTVTEERAQKLWLDYAAEKH